MTPDLAALVAQARADHGHLYAVQQLIAALESLSAENARLLAAQQMVWQQAEDEGLWFAARTAPEAYLQQELRKLHSVIEGTTP